jgi:hypothetical protein
MAIQNRNCMLPFSILHQLPFLHPIRCQMQHRAHEQFKEHPICINKLRALPYSCHHDYHQSPAALVHKALSVLLSFPRNPVCVTSFSSARFLDWCSLPDLLSDQVDVFFTSTGPVGLPRISLYQFLLELPQPLTFPDPEC